MVLEIDGKKAWVFHGDVFDVTMKYSKWLAKLGAVGYDLLIVINNIFNFFSEFVGMGRISFSKKIKNSVKAAVKYINDFEQTAGDLAIDKKYDLFICGHIHRPQDKMIYNEKGSVRYLNSGDWIENNTALEYHLGVWSVFSFDDEMKAAKKANDERKETDTRPLVNF
jgi:UDP-2,3-diacylglucosamine pyrophosphatase LpxH